MSSRHPVTMAVERLRRARDAAGICRECGVRPARAGRTACVLCAHERKAYDRARYLQRKEARARS